MRVSLHLDETDACNPIPVLYVNGQELRLNEFELDELWMETIWIKNCISQAHARHFHSLAHKYKDEQRRMGDRK